MEEWFHINVPHSYSNPITWKKAEAHVVKDTEKLLEIFSKNKVKVTFLVLGWVAKKYPTLIKKISDLGHEIGSHGFYHRFAHSLTPEEFELDVRVTLELLRNITNQPVDIFRAPSFSIRQDNLWCLSILAKLGIKTDISIVPASRDGGGIIGFPKDPFILETINGEIEIVPVSVMEVAGKAIQFSGGGFLRILPTSLINYGFKQNHLANRSVMSFIHPREINPNHPKIKFDWLTFFRCYGGLSTVEGKLNYLFKNYNFSTITDVHRHNSSLPRFFLNESNEIKSHNGV